MSSTSANSKLSAFKNKIASKITAAIEVTYKDIPVPKSAQNILDSFCTASNPQTTASNVYRIDVCPDFTPSMLYLLLEAQQQRSAIAAVRNPKVSAYTLVAYELHLIYIWFLLHDLYVSPSDCSFAKDLIEDQVIQDHLDFCLDLPVPEPVLTVLSAWATSNLENQKNIWLCPSFSNYIHYTHFGRSYPTSIFFAMHNTIAEFAANTGYPELLYAFGTEPLYYIRKFNKDTLVTTAPSNARRPALTDMLPITADNYFSLLRQGATATTPAPIENKINQILRAFASFDSIKGLKSASSYEAIPISPPVFNEETNIFNPYVMLTSLNMKNASELMTVFRAVKDVIHLNKYANKSLAVLFDQVPSSGIANHGYSDHALPHWDCEPASTITAPTRADTRVKSTDLDTYRDSIEYKQDTLITTSQPATSWTASVRSLGRTLVRFTTSPPTIPADRLTSLTIITTFIAPVLSLARTTLPNRNAQQTIQNANLNTDLELDQIPLADDTVNDVDDNMITDFPVKSFKSFNEHHDVYPYVKVIMPQGSSSSTAPLVALRGLVIFSEDLTNAIVPQLHSLSELYDDNALFLQSAVPYYNTYLATDVRSTNPTPSRATNLPLVTALNQPAASLLRTSATIYAEQYARTTFGTGTQTFLNHGLTVPNALQRVPQFTQTFLGLHVPTRAKNDAAHIQQGPANTVPRQHLIWSPYTFRAPTFQYHELSDITRGDSATIQALKGTYFLTNLRTLFGTSQQVYRVESALHSLPSA